MSVHLKMFDEDKVEFGENATNDSKKGFFRTVFRRGKVEILPFQELNPRANIKFDKLKKLLLIVIICALTLTVLLIVKQLTIKDRLDSILSQEQITDGTESSLNSATDQLLSDNMEEVVTHRSTQSQSTAQTSTTTLSTTTKIITTLGTIPTTVTTQRSTTMGTTPTTTTTAPKMLDHLLATIVINRATVPDKDGYTDVSDPYVKAYVDNTYIGQTPVRKNTLTPNWNYQIAHQMILRPDSVLQFELFDSDRYTSHEYIGKITIKTSELISDGNNGKQIYRYHGSGRLWFTVTWDEVYRNY